MKKNKFLVPLNRNWKKLLLTMKLCLLFLLISAASLMANSGYSQKTTLSIHLKNATLRDFISEVEKQSEFIFVFYDDIVDLDRRVDVESDNQKIDEILDKIFKSSELTYRIFDRQIGLGKRDPVTGAIELPPSLDKLIAADKKTISGAVKDAKGLPLPGVTVVVKGTTTGTITDNDGKFILKVPDEAKILVFTFVGMKAQEVAIAGETAFNVVMDEEIVGLEEVVAIGYGTVKKRDLTGSVSSVSGGVLQDIPVTSAAQAIVGRMPGVQVTKTEGSPDAEIKIRVRGGGSITQDNSPLYIVDGFPVNNINDISPTDIASIDILKDASSTAIYGSRGANGVIIITTKVGFEGKGKVSYNTYFGVKKPTKMLDVLDPYEYVYWQHELQNTQSTNNAVERYFGDFQDFGLYKQMNGTDWQDEMFGRTGTSQYHNIAVSGGSKTSKYNISLSRNDEEEIMIGSGYTRTNLTINTSHKINNWLTIEMNSRLSDSYIKGAGTSSDSRLSHAVQYRPINGLSDFIDRTLDEEGYEISDDFILNPLKQTNDDYRRSKRLNFNFNGAATITLSENLNYRFAYGSQYSEDSYNRFYGINTSNAMLYGYKPLASISKTDSKSYRLANILTYNKKDFLPGNNMTIMIGEELNNSKSGVVRSSAKYFPKYVDAVSALSMMNLGLADPIATSDSPPNVISSFFGRLNYDYQGKYLASFTFRADGSSKFAEGNRWGYFPSAALAWRISDEKFMSITEQWLTDLKLRASYGESGNNRISDNAWQKTFSVIAGELFLEGDETTPTSYLLPNSVLSNPKLKWETTVTRNLGLDFGLFKQRLSGSVEVYKNTTRDLLISATIPSSTGYSTQWQNIGQTSNKGLEVVLNGVLIEKKDFRLAFSFNIGFNKNRIDKLGETKSWEQSSGWAPSDGPIGDYFIEEGGQIGSMYGYETEGMYSFDDFNYNDGTYTLKEGISNNSSLIRAKWFWPGTLKLKDQNGDLIVNSANDKVVIGNANPKHTGGFNLTAQYKGFDCSTFLNWVYGNNIYNANKLYFTTFASSRYFKNILNIMNSDNRFIYFSKETGVAVSDPSELQAMNQNATMWSPAMSTAVLHSWAIEDGSFLRLNNITIGYSLPKKFLNKFSIEKLRFYVTAYNLWTWTNYSGYDPEVDIQRSTPLTPGVDWCAYPRSRSLNVGLNLEF